MDRAIDRELVYRVFREAVAACDPGARVAAALARAPELADDAAGARVGIAVGKGALAMARGAGPVSRGIAVTVDGAEGAVPAGWRVMHAAHPVPDERSVAAGAAVRELVAGAAADDVVIALVSGGASALIEQPRIALAAFRDVIATLMAAGAPIAELNTVRSALSEVKGGALALACPARIVTLVTSDVVGDALDVIGSGPTIGPWLDGSSVDVGAWANARRHRAIAILERFGICVPDVMHAASGSWLVERRDRAALIAPLAACADAACALLAAAGITAHRSAEPLAGDVRDVADQLAASSGVLVAYGEPTLRVAADHGDGGRAQQLALELATRFRGTPRAALVAGTDGIDGPAPRDRAAPAGAFVDGTTWDAIVRAGIDPERALARCDAGTALDAAGALVVTGPTGINHADLVIVS